MTYLARYKIQDGESVYYQYLTFGAKNSIEALQIAETYRLRFWEDSEFDDPIVGTPKDPRLEMDRYWDSTMTRLVSVVDVQELSEDEATFLEKISAKTMIAPSINGAVPWCLAKMTSLA